MTEKERMFLNYAVVEQMKYAEIEECLGVERKQLTLWWDNLKEERDKLSNIRKTWVKKFKKVSFWKFHDWYVGLDRKCFYCNITESEIEELLEGEQLKTKRIKTRGKKLEIERIEPNEKYDNLDNLVLSLLLVQ